RRAARASGDARPVHRVRRPHPAAAQHPRAGLLHRRDHRPRQDGRRRRRHLQPGQLGWHQAVEGRPRARAHLLGVGRRPPDHAPQPRPLARRGILLHRRLAAAQRQRGGHGSGAVLGAGGRVRSGVPRRVERDPAQHDHFLRELAVGRLGLDHDRVLMGKYAIPVLTRHLHNRGGRFLDGAEADKALYWYVHAALRGRFTGPTETHLAKDLETVDKAGIDGLIAALARTRKGNMSIDAQDFEGIGRGSRSYPLVYLLARVTGARDLVTGRPLGSDASAVQVHEVFPKQALNRAGYSRAEVNQIANFTFLTPSSAMQFAGLPPEAYLGALDPDARRSQFIPDDPGLWRIENYRDFLDARRQLLAAAANEFLDDLLAGRRPWAQPLEAIAVSPEVDETDARAM